ncbi:SRPBCC domain-containing protein [Spirosoma sp. SC4-14]|uniref:SRPBCC family protein n=1 Tax=Spirosoma sp. SC4-14 TaxID=3128900 RepID=UPI0030D10BC0
MTNQAKVAEPVVRKQITIDAPVSKVWHLLTSPALIKRWMLDTEIEVISDWQVGSSIRFRGDLHGKYEQKGTIVQFEPNVVFAYTSWSALSRLPDKAENYTTVEFNLIPADNQTMLIVTHRNLIAETAVEHASFYWNGTLGIIKKIAEE